MMPRTVHTILGLYSSGEGDPKEVQEAVRTAHAQSIRLFQSDEDGKSSPYGQLRIDGESLIVATALTADVERIIKALESTGSPAIFILHEDLAQPAALRMRGTGSIFARLHE